jgi:hypothetical protein
METTTANLIELVRPFVGAKAFPQRDPNARYGGYLPQTEAVDILCQTNKINADVRSVTEAGIEVFFYDRCEFVPWGEVRRIVVRSLGGNGETTGQAVYERCDLAVAA